MHVVLVYENSGCTCVVQHNIDNVCVLCFSGPKANSGSMICKSPHNHRHPSVQPFIFCNIMLPVFARVQCSILVDMI